MTDDDGSRRPILDLTRRFTFGGRTMPLLWDRRSIWQLRLRWLVPPAIVVSFGISRLLGFELARPILLVAAFILVYNATLAVVVPRLYGRAAGRPALDRVFTIVQASLDYAAMFLLIYFTGGVASPLIFFFIFHVIFAAILFRPSIGYLFVAIATVGMACIAVGTSMGWLSPRPVLFRGTPFTVLEQPAHMIAWLLFFAASVMITAAATSTIMRVLRRPVRDLAQASERINHLNEQLNSLYAMVRAIGSENRLEPVLSTITSELAVVMGVEAATVKLLSPDGKRLKFEAAFGLPFEYVQERSVDVERSSWNRRIIKGEACIHGSLKDADGFQLQEELLRAGIQSVIFGPLKVQERVIGILGAYSHRIDRFDDTDTDFFRLAAELAAIAIESARTYEAIQHLMEDRSRFMMQVAHNMRSPLNAVASMLQGIDGGYLGEISPQQREYLQRMMRRLEGMTETIGQLLTLAHNQDPGRPMERQSVELGDLATHVRRIFADRAAQKDLRLEVQEPVDLPALHGDPEMLRQLLENLVSNAVKYTPSGGEIAVGFTLNSDGTVRIKVRDTGIGIPQKEQGRLFTEFYRASNAKELDAVGTGLGLAIVKQTVERHGGRIHLDSDEGQGTTISIDLHTAQVERTPPA